MRRLLPILALVLLCLAPAWAEGFSYDKEFEVRLCPDGTKLAPPLAGDPQATMALVQQLYEIAGPKIGCRFVEPCYLLCLGGLRPYAAWNGFMVDPQPEDDEVYDRLNRFLVPRGLSLHVQRARPDGVVASFSLYSLEGLERRTRQTGLPWVPRYHRETGWPGYYAWMREVFRHRPEGDEGFGHRVEGLRLGYPDVALAHYEHMVLGDWPTTVDATLPGAYLYQNGVPVFSLRSQDAADPGVVALEHEWNGFLEAAYATAAHRQLSSQKAFLDARRRRCGGNPLFRESGLLGLTVEVPEWPLNSSHERWLSLHLEELLEALRGTSDLRELARPGSAVGLSGRHLWGFLLRGSLGQDPVAGRLYRAFRELYPDVFLAHYRRELKGRAEAILERGAVGRGPACDAEPLVQMLQSPDGPGWLSQLEPEEQRPVFQAVELRRQHPALKALVEEAVQGRGPLVAMLQRLRQQEPALWQR